EHLLDEYYAVQSLDPTKAPLLLERIGELVHGSNLHRDLGCAEAPTAEQVPGLLPKLDGYLCEIKEAQIRDGLHILGLRPEGGQLVDLLLALVRVDNGPVPGLVKALAQNQGLNHAELTKDLAAPAPSVLGTPYSVRGPCRTCGDVVEALTGLA